MVLSKSNYHSLIGIGKELEHGGFNVDLIREACVIYWGLIFDDDPQIQKDTVQFTSSSKLEELSEDCLQRGYRKIHLILPEEVRRVTTPQALRAAYDRSLEGFIESVRSQGNTIVGYYDPPTDTCWLSTAILPIESRSLVANQASIAAHELCHRYLHHQREDKDGMIGNQALEGKFFRDFEGGFWRMVFQPPGWDYAKLKRDCEVGKQRFQADLPLLIGSTALEDYKEAVILKYVHLLDSRKE